LNRRGRGGRSSLTAEDAEDAEDTNNNALGFLCVLRVLCGSIVLLRALFGSMASTEPGIGLVFLGVPDEVTIT